MSARPSASPPEDSATRSASPDSPLSPSATPSRPKLTKPPLAAALHDDPDTGDAASGGE